MKTIIFYITLILIFLGASSCKKKLDVLLDAPKELVVGGLFWADSIWIVSVFSTESVLADEKSFNPINQAIIEITDEDGEATLLKLDSTYYGTFNSRKWGLDTFYYFTSKEIPPKEGSQYSINVQVPDYPEATASDRVPEKANIVSLNLGKARSSPDDPQFSYSSEVDLVVELSDPREIDNYYQISIYILREQIDPQSGEMYKKRYKVPYTTFDNSAFSVNGTPLVDYIYNDKSFDGQEKSISLKLTFDDELDELIGKKLEVEILSLSETYYKTIISFQQGDISNENALTGVIDFFKEPLPTFTNIEGGYGVFAGAGRYKDVLLIE